MFIDAGAGVWITSRRTEVAERAAERLGGNVVGVRLDPHDQEQTSSTLSGLGQMDFVIVTLGSQAITAPFMQLSEADLGRALEDKFLAYTRVLRAVWGKVTQSVTWLTGAAARVAVEGLGNYAATNGALHAIMSPLAMEMAPVRLNSVAAGVTRTAFWAGLGMSVDAQQAMYSQAAGSLPVGRVAEPQDIAHALYFAAVSPFLTGAVVDINGGLHLRQTPAAVRGGSFGSVPAQP
jgi:NAD(P)-dependent dehydrogenase (short-subunit alcohol dehydrogenase family)